MKLIFVLMACTEYEGSCMAKAFANKEDANAVCKKANEHIEAKPRISMLSTEEEDDAWDIAFQEWQSKHPAGEGHHYADSFEVREIELIGA